MADCEKELRELKRKLSSNTQIQDNRLTSNPLASHSVVFELLGYPPHPVQPSLSTFHPPLQEDGMLTT